MANNEKDTERAQATVRLVLGFLGTLYAPLLAMEGMLPQSSARLMAAHGTLFIIVSLVLRFAIVRWPGNYPSRRLFAMLLDYSALGFHMILGDEDLLPVYALVLWVTVGYGIRYGSAYLAISTGIALATLLVVGQVTPYWQAQPYIMWTLLLTTLLVPAYTHVLLRENKRAYEREREATLAKTRFLAQASHDLRQPIHSIALFTDCLRDEHLNARQAQLVDNIDRSLHSVSHLFRSILDSYTLDSGRLEARFDVVPVRELLDTVISESRDSARWADVDVRVRAGDHLIRTDPNLICTVVQNLVENAVKYGEGKPVLVAARRRGDRLSLQVYDQGRGIPQESLDKVFDEFYRVRQQRDKDIGGLGLGLSIVKRICTLLGAAVSIRSTIGRGTVVNVDGFEIVRHLPKAQLRSGEQGASVLNGLRVLLIEDDVNVLMATALLLERWGCIVQRATTLPVLPGVCDVVISDYDLNAQITGAECIARIRQALGPQLPALLLTGHDTKAVRGKLADPDLPILAKPVRPAELRSLLTSLVLEAAHPANLVRV
ncbi:hybrid sensor histidine kinase/response regulator [Bordetella muralis]|jgi:signal transduction histidine kinase|uniref:ATP-binding response regulator n=1 Tax=Bordetella muralis TaxID=1649130 RepID=UPI0039EF0D74